MLAFFNSEFVFSSLVYNELIKDYTKLLQDVKSIKNAADAEGEHKTSAMMDDIIERGYDPLVYRLFNFSCHFPSVLEIVNLNPHHLNLPSNH